MYEKSQLSPCQVFSSWYFGFLFLRDLSVIGGDSSGVYHHEHKEYKGGDTIWGCFGFDGEKMSCGRAVAPAHWVRYPTMSNLVNADSYEYRLAA